MAFLKKTRVFWTLFLSAPNSTPKNVILICCHLWWGKRLGRHASRRPLCTLIASRHSFMSLQWRPLNGRTWLHVELAAADLGRGSVTSARKIASMLLSHNTDCQTQVAYIHCCSLTENALLIASSFIGFFCREKACWVHSHIHFAITGHGPMLHPFTPFRRIHSRNHAAREHGQLCIRETHM